MSCLQTFLQLFHLNAPAGEELGQLKHRESVHHYQTIATLLCPQATALLQLQQSHSRQYIYRSIFGNWLNLGNVGIGILIVHVLTIITITRKHGSGQRGTTPQWLIVPSTILYIYFTFRPLVGALNEVAWWHLLSHNMAKPEPARIELQVL